METALRPESWPAGLGSRHLGSRKGARASLPRAAGLEGEDSGPVEREQMPGKQFPEGDKALTAAGHIPAMILARQLHGARKAPVHWVCWERWWQSRIITSV